MDTRICPELHWQCYYDPPINLPPDHTFAGQSSQVVLSVLF